MDSSIAVNVAAASYEGSLFSWRAACDPSAENIQCELVMTSGFHCCAGSLKAIAVSESGNYNISRYLKCLKNPGKYMVCGGADERIRYIAMKNKC